ATRSSKGLSGAADIAHRHAGSRKGCSNGRLETYSSGSVRASIPSEYAEPSAGARDPPDLATVPGLLISSATGVVNTYASRHACSGGTLTRRARPCSCAAESQPGKGPVARYAGGPRARSPVAPDVPAP